MYVCMYYVCMYYQEYIRQGEKLATVSVLSAASTCVVAGALNNQPPGEFERSTPPGSENSARTYDKLAAHKLL